MLLLKAGGDTPLNLIRIALVNYNEVRWCKVLLATELANSLMASRMLGSIVTITKIDEEQK